MGAYLIIISITFLTVSTIFISRHLLMIDDEDSEGLVFRCRSSPADRRWSATAPLPTLTHFTRGFRKHGELAAVRPAWPLVKPNPEKRGWGSSAPPIFTILAGVVHQDDLLQEDGRGGVQDAVDGPQQGAPGFVVKHDDHAGGWQGGAPLEGLLNTSVAKKKKKAGRKNF